MGVFSQRPEEELRQWGGLPSEPRDHEGVDQLSDAPTVDPMDVGLGAQYSTVVFPVAAPAPAVTETTNADAGDDD